MQREQALLRQVHKSIKKQTSLEELSCSTEDSEH